MGENPECLRELGDEDEKFKYNLRDQHCVLALGGWAPLDEHQGLGQHQHLQEAAPALGHLSGSKGAGHWMDRCCGRGRRGEDGGNRAWVLARKASSARLGS